MPIRLVLLLVWFLQLHVIDELKGRVGRGFGRGLQVSALLCDVLLVMRQFVYISKHPLFSYTMLFSASYSKIPSLISFHGHSILTVARERKGVH